MSALNVHNIRRLLGLNATTTATKLNYLDITTAGVAEASKALILNSSKGIATITSATITTLTSTTGNITTVASTTGNITTLNSTTGNITTVASTTGNITTLNSTTGNVTTINAGASGTAGTVNVFPTTASKGKLALTVTDQTGNTTVGLTIGAMAAARTITLADPGAAANIVTDVGIGGSLLARCTAQIDAVTGTTGTTLTDITGLSVNVLAAGVYAFKAYLSGTATANSGLKIAIGGTATATSINYTGKNYNSTTLNANTTTTTLGAAVGAATAVITDAIIEGTIVVDAAGTLTVQFAQNAAHVDTTSVYINSNFQVTRIA